MKITIVSKAIFAVALMFSLSSFAFETKESHGRPTSPNKVAFNASIFQVRSSNKVKLAIDNGSESTLRVTLKDQAGKTFYNETYKKGEQPYRRVFDLEGMNDGTYYFELTAGDQKLTKEIAIQTKGERVISVE